MMGHRINRRLFIAGLLLATLFDARPANAKRTAETITRTLLSRLLRRDAARDRVLAARPIQRDRHVWRYTSRSQAEREAQNGIASRSHLTSGVRPGRPPTPRTAQRRYGLPEPPEVRETVVIPKGHPVKVGKALGGTPGTGEVTSPISLPKEGITKVTPLGPGK
jgi:hypothetical protein